jgi:hypothetical protein
MQRGYPPNRRGVTGQAGTANSLAILLFMFSMVSASGELLAQSAGATAFDTRPVVIRRLVTQGLAKTVNENLFKCEVPLRNYRISAVGTIAADNGTVLALDLVFESCVRQSGPRAQNGTLTSRLHHGDDRCLI